MTGTEGKERRRERKYKRGGYKEGDETKVEGWGKVISFRK